MHIQYLHMKMIKKFFAKNTLSKGDRPLTFRELRSSANHRLSTIQTEFKKMFNFLNDHRRSVSFFGSSRTIESDKYYIQARKLSQRIVRELKYAVVTGGGPGIMEAANRGAYEAGGQSIGMNIVLPEGQKSNPYTTAHMTFYYFFVRKVALTFSAEAYLFFPGGYGTLDEFFELINLLQSKKIQHVPLILVGSDYWKDLDLFIKTQLLARHKTISPQDASLYTITDSEDEIIDIIRKSPLRRE